MNCEYEISQSIHDWWVRTANRIESLGVDAHSDQLSSFGSTKFIWCAPQKEFQMLRESLCQFRQGDFDDEEKGKAAHAGANS